MPQHGKKQVHSENLGQHPHRNRHEGEQEPGYTDLALEEGHDLIYRAEEEAHMHDDETMMPQSSSTSTSKKLPESSSQSGMVPQETMSHMGEQGGITQGHTAKMMPESTPSSSEMGSMGQQQQHMESGSQQSGGGMGKKIGEMKEGMGQKMGELKEGLKKGMGMGHHDDNK
ncbi:hypothetical protein QBC32DRAFT_372006 [Pseudoneurospora amorphoporcata]|uniref:Uncharacterized protein n=1 Tax=Pseudoneurospora amorphoporcata TaxID=241081 RepID=A0AAN6SET7_9PEZI|nr:hypothetical protein QBC32DRAFT_372006 [Pseudoneurospora amorphoporcata]